MNSLFLSYAHCPVGLFFSYLFVGFLCIFWIIIFCWILSVENIFLGFCALKYLPVFNQSVHFFKGFILKFYHSQICQSCSLCFMFPTLRSSNYQSLAFHFKYWIGMEIYFANEGKYGLKNCFFPNGKFSDPAPFIG